MRRISAAIILVAAAAALPTASAAAGSAVSDSTQVAISTFISSNIKAALAQTLSDLRSDGVDFDSAAVVRMVAADLTTPYDRDAHSAAYQTVMMAVMKAREAANESFMAEARQLPGAVELPDGLIFREVTPGNGPKATAESTVMIRYRGVLPDGTVFDEITPEQEPMTTKPGQLVPGMTEGLCMMQAGGNYTLFIPAALAYGSRGAGDVIPPDTPLRFDVEMVDIK